MGCFLGCFRIKDDERRRMNLISHSISSKNRDPLVSRNQLASVFLCEEKGSPCKEAADLGLQDYIDKSSVDRDLKQEVKFLKSCGAILETPAEIRKASEKIIAPALYEDSVANFHSLLPEISCKKLCWDEPLDQNSISLPRAHDDSGFAENKSGRDIFEELQTGRDCLTASPSVTSLPPIAAVQCKSKFVRFECVNNVSGVESGLGSVPLDLSPSEADSQIQPLGHKHSPYPTPLHLTDEMQTPGTVYASKLENPRAGKNARIRTQYVYPVLNPVENLSQWKVLREGSPQLGQSIDILEQQFKSASPDGRDMTEQCSPKLSYPNNKINENSGMISKENSIFGKSRPNHSILESEEAPDFDIREQVDSSVHSQIVVSSLSQWFKIPPPNDEIGGYSERHHSRKSPDGDRPILGTVAAHWNDDEPSRISPKWWDGNGIPNSTTKYKEDSKVSWHATPFEQRLEKALSDEKVIPQRKLYHGRPIEFEEDDEESDTAAS